MSNTEFMTEIEKQYSEHYAYINNLKRKYESRQKALWRTLWIWLGVLGVLGVFGIVCSGLSLLLM